MKFEQTTTRHGTPLFVYSMPYLRSVAAGVLVFAGSRDETWPQEAGLAHALEHMMFQGNEQCPDSRSISEEVESVGGSLNAWTADEATFYYRAVPDYAFPIAVSSLDNQLSSSLHREADIMKEMKNVVQEIRRANDDPSRFAGRLLTRSLYKGHPLAQETLGTEESVQSFTTLSFKSWCERWYSPKNYALIATGNTTLAEAERLFNGAKFRAADTANGKNVRPRIPLTMANERTFEHKDVKQAHVRLGVAMSGLTEWEQKALSFYARMISGGMASPLFQELRDKRGLCYAVGAGVGRDSDCTSFIASIGTDPVRMQEAITAIHEIFEKHRDDNELFEYTKRRIRGSNLRSFCEPEHILSGAARDLLLGRDPRTLVDIEQDLLDLQPEYVKEAVEKFLLDREAYAHAYVVPHGTKI